jgi:hypothetical protein
MMSDKLAAWVAAAPNRDVLVSDEPEGATEHVCDCLENGKRVVLGTGPDPEAAMKNACDQLWALALAAAAQPPNPRPRWRK